MKSLVRSATIAAVLWVWVVAVPQQAVAPPPKPVDGGPSLQDTVAFVLGKLGDLGKETILISIHSTVDGSDYTNTATFEYSKFRSGSTSCHVVYHEKLLMDSDVRNDQDFGFNFHDVEDVVVKPYEQYQNDQNAAAGKPTQIVTSTNPPMVVLLVRRAHGVFNRLIFSDAGIADRVAKAMTHAIELCGGGSKDPF